ncbi:probable inactive poly [ADP-ribose] polymerase SRO2 isoform X2 [Zingiber officinale]|uniref:probable inactive poly [ADP-ribose] polymerase SRO2 isoform X2 n=1 Tax=Zingiber officinale TaxID=94328 RepID=UPI001C4B9019|nr:probable inactive poly [ADP-ribose] polymerase SRO2 isoform X2 [Zingiber officinale]
MRRFPHGHFRPGSGPLPIYINSTRFIQPPPPLVNCVRLLHLLLRPNHRQTIGGAIRKSFWLLIHSHTDRSKKASGMAGWIGKKGEESPAFEGNGMVRIGADSEEFILLRHRFYTSIGSLVPHCALLHLHRYSYAAPATRARWEAFLRCVKSTALENGGDANEKFAFREASRDWIIQIGNRGLDLSSEMSDDGGYFGVGLYLTPEPVSINSVMSSVVDGDGLRHVLLCRVALGRSEEVVCGTGQSHPSSKDFHSGIDNLKKPTRYVVWYHDVPIRILPLYVLSFKVDFRNRGLLQKVPVKGPSSPWISITHLLLLLSKFLPRPTICQIKKFHCEFKERKISRQQLVLRIREVTGDKILRDAIKSFQDKRAAAARLASRTKD